MDFDWTSGELAAGLECFQRAEFFEAHEHWETLWRQAEGAEKNFLHALIQLAVALCHHQRGNRVGAIALFQKSLQRLNTCPDSFAGVDVKRLRCDVHAWIEYLEHGPAAAAPIVIAIR